jgi:hypothetical protein
MPQFDFNYEDLGLVGSVATAELRNTFSVENPLRSQVTNLEYNGITTDGDYSLTVVGSDGSSATSEPYAASGDTAAQIVAGIAAQALLSPGFAGLLSSIAVATTDNLVVSFEAPGVEFVVTANVPGSAPTQTNSTTAGYGEIALGVILQSDGSGGWTTTYTDAALALGVVVRAESELIQPMISSTVAGYIGPCMLPVMSMGPTNVNVAVGITVKRGQKVYFNSNAKTWSNVTTGSHVLVEGAQWRTSGTTKQRVFVRFPSET